MKDDPLPLRDSLFAFCLLPFAFIVEL